MLAFNQQTYSQKQHIKIYEANILIAAYASPVTETPVCLSPEVSQVGPVFLLVLVLDRDQGRAKPARDIVLFACDAASPVSLYRQQKGVFHPAFSFTVTPVISVLVPEVVTKRRCRQEEPGPSVSAEAA